MKKLLIPMISSLPVLLLMLGTPAMADLSCTSPNLVALVFPETGDINAPYVGGVVFPANVVLLNPTTADISGFEFRLTISNPGSIFKLSDTLPPQAINVGNAVDINVGLDYIVGLGTPLPPMNNAFTLVQFQFLDFAGLQQDFYLSPTEPASIPGSLAFVSGPDFPLYPMDPISRDFALPIGRLVIEGPELDYCSNEPIPYDLFVDIAFQGDSDNTAGTAPGARDDYDAAFDRPDENLALTFPHPEWFSPVGDNFKTDVKAPFDPTVDVKQWTFVTRTNFSQSGAQGQDVTINFAPSFADSGFTGLYLLDRTTGQQVDLFPANAYTYFAPGGTDSRTFDLFIGALIEPMPTLIVDVDAYLGEFSDTGNRAATNELASDGYDPGLDTPEPTPPPADYLVASFEQPNWPLGPRFTTDVRALFDPLAETRTWPLTVETDQTGMVTLMFGPNFSEFANYGLTLKDLRSGQTFNLFPELSYVFNSPGPGTYRFELSIGLTLPPALDPTSRNIPAGWSMVGMPLEPFPGQDSLDDVILGQVPGFGYMFDYGGTGGYNPLAGSTIAQLGTGYWIGTDAGFNWTMSGSFALEGVEIPMLLGWNLIGNPMWFPGPVENIQVKYAGGILDWPTAVALGLVSNTVYAYDMLNDTYVNTLDMQPWNGYWVSALTEGVSLFFDWRIFQTMPTRFTAQSLVQAQTGFSWQTDIQLIDAEQRSRTITLGLDNMATAGYDPIFDLPQPPPSPQGGPMLAVQRPEWDLASGQYFTTDIAGTGPEPVEWKILISSPTPGKAVLFWDSTAWPEGMDFQLYHPVDNRVVVMSMRQESTYIMDLGDAPLSLIIRTPNMISGVGDTPGLAYDLKVYPNPFNPMTTLHFEMAKPGVAEIRIYSVRGELISTLEGSHREAGRHKATWRGTDRQGRNAPSGSYFAKLYVDGQTKGDVVKMSLVR